MLRRACAPSDYSNQTAHSRSLIRIFTGRISVKHIAMKCDQKQIHVKVTFEGILVIVQYQEVCHIE